MSDTLVLNKHHILRTLCVVLEVAFFHFIVDYQSRMSLMGVNFSIHQFNAINYHCDLSQRLLYNWAFNANMIKGRTISILRLV